MLESLQEILQSAHPLLFLFCLILFPLGPIPISPIWILAGVRFGPTTAIALSSIGLILNLSLSYLLSRTLLRNFLQKVLSKRIAQIPSIEATQQLSLTLFVRLLPGNPLCIQNYLLGILGVRPFWYFIIGLPIQLAYATAFILLGQALFEGTVGSIIIATPFTVAIIAGIRTAASYYKKNLNAKATQQ